MSIIFQFLYFKVTKCKSNANDLIISSNKNSFDHPAKYDLIVFSTSYSIKCDVLSNTFWVLEGDNNQSQKASSFLCYCCGSPKHLCLIQFAIAIQICSLLSKIVRPFGILCIKIISSVSQKALTFSCRELRFWLLHSSSVKIFTLWGIVEK